MTTGTIIMIVCAVLYGLIVILFKKDMDDISKQEAGDMDDPFVGIDGSPGACGVCSDDLGVFKKSR